MAFFFPDTGSSGLLKQALLPVVNVDKCNSTDYLDGEATDNMICAGYDKGGIDSCQVNHPTTSLYISKKCTH